MKKIGILTFHRSINYGSVLQATALYRLISTHFNNYSVEIININYLNREFIDFFKYIRNSPLCIFNAFLLKHYLNKNVKLSKFKYFKNIDEGIEYINAQKYEIIITGSDEIWKKNNILSIPNIYWLPPGINSIKISFAASANNTNYSDYTYKEILFIESCLKHYHMIIVRDQHTKQLISNFTKKNIYNICDPTFLVDWPYKSIHLTFFLSKINFRKKIIAIMIGNKNISWIINHFNNSDYELISINKPHKGTKYMWWLSPTDFSNIFRHCDLIFTSYFHGTIFSIINHSSFICLDYKNYRQSKSKILDLLINCDLESRYYSCSDPQKINKSEILSLADMLLSHDNTDYNKITEKQKNNLNIILENLKKIIK